MSKFIIQGGKPLEGEVTCAGSKNAATPILASTLLFNQKCVFDNVPGIKDVEVMTDLLRSLGAVITETGKNKIEVECGDASPGGLEKSLVSALRSSVLLIGPLLSRFGEISLPEPGGCRIGPRTLDTHLDALTQLGIEVKAENEIYHFRNTGQLNNEVVLKEFSVTATENVIMLCALEEGERTIHLAAQEPHVRELIEFLNGAGAKIKISGPNEIKIEGVKELKAGEHRIRGDYLEAGTWAVAAAVTRGSVKINGVDLRDLKIVIKKLREIGLEVLEGDDFFKVRYNGIINPFKLQTLPFPGFPTDLQAPFGLLALLANGESHIYDTLFEGRLGYLLELEKMGAKFTILNPHEAKIYGPKKIKGTDLASLDIRAGATMLLAGLSAEGKTTIDRAEMIDRGYDKVQDKISSLGGDIERIN